MKVSKVVLSEQIKAQLMDEIITGTYKPGDRLVESSLSKQFDVSQSPVREALKGLIEMGLVVQEPYKGTTVRDISSKDLHEVFSVRAALESLAAGLAAERCTSDDISVLEGMLVRMAALAEAGDEKNRIRMNNLFHDEIIRISGHSLIAKLSKSLRFAGWSQRKGSRFSKDEIVNLVARHRKIIDSIASHNVAGAEAEMRRHIEENLPVAHEPEKT